MKIAITIAHSAISSPSTVYGFYTRRLIGQIILGLVLVLGSSLGWAAPNNLEDYQVSNGGYVNIQNHAYVEGSVSKGGIQPDYIIDIDKEPLKSFLERCELIGKQPLSYWDKVALVTEITKLDYFKYRDYLNPYYRRLLKRFREANQDIPLSEYGACSAGVCREYAMVMHFALKAAGIANNYAYAKIYRRSKTDGYEITEDHAFNVVRHQGTDWVVDAYYGGFHGFRLKDILSPQGVTEKSVASPLAKPRPGTRRIIEINQFPKVYNPIPKLSCSKTFL